jgi:hypothetical protein
MSLLMPELERQLRTAARARGAEHNRRSRRKIPGLGLLTLALSVVVVAAVAVPTILLLGHRSPRTATAAGGGIPQPIPGETTRIERCGPPFGAFGTGQASSVPSGASGTAYVVEAQGSLAGHIWSLLARRGENGLQAVEDGRLRLDGRPYGMCPGAPNPAEFSLIDAGAHGIVYGYIADPGSYTIRLHPRPIATRPLLRRVLGGTFFIQALPKPACSYPSLTLTASTSGASFQHFYSFGRCTAGEQVAITGGYGSWGGKLLPRPHLRGPGGGRVTPHGIPTPSQLLANFAVLRRPQTAADRSWRPPPPASYARSLPSLTRLAGTLPDGTRIFLTVQRYTGPGWPSVYPVGSYELDINIVPATGHNTYSTNFGPNVNYTVFPLSSTPARILVRHGSDGPTAPAWASIIPDGVSSVRWTFECQAARCAQRQVTVTVGVHENVAAASIPATEPKHGSSPAPSRPWQPTATAWYGRGGRVLATYGLSANNLSAPPFIKTR